MYDHILKYYIYLVDIKNCKYQFSFNKYLSHFLHDLSYYNHRRWQSNENGPAADILEIIFKIFASIPIQVQCYEYFEIRRSDVFFR
jgi:hypothetical protein